MKVNKELQQELQNLNNKLDKLKHKLAAAEKRNDKVMVYKFQNEINAIQKSIASAKDKKTRELSTKGESIKALAFNRALSKEEQSDMGKFKKTVKGLVVVHPLTALGRELALDKVTGFAPTKF